METILQQNHLFSQHFILNNRANSEPVSLPSYTTENLAYNQQEEAPDPYIGAFEGSAWAEHIGTDPITPHSSPNNGDASTENSVCANNGSFDEGLPGGLSECFQNCVLDSNTDKSPGGRRQRRIRNRNRRKAGQIIIEAKSRLKKLFIRYLGSKEAKAIIKQEIRHSDLLRNSKYKSLRGFITKHARRSLDRRLQGCVCYNVGGLNLHTPICLLTKKLWIIFLDKRVEHNVLQLIYISGTMRKILLRIASMFKNNLTKERK